jgi:7-cyano-7-deazaguanine synthase in queuosine biosynthesis
MLHYYLNNFMKYIQYNDFTFDIYDGNLGAFVSGGADSALMLYMLMSNINQPLHIFSAANGKSNYREPINALKVINKVMGMTGFDPNNLRFYTHWTKHKTTDNVMLAEYMQTVKVDTVYFGFTRPPPVDAITDFDTTNVAAQGGVDHKLVLDTYYDDLSKAPWHFFQDTEFSYPQFTQSYYVPFININKQKIALLYRELGIEDLYKITRSCESTIVNDRHCGSCWWCKERIWGFGYLD